MKDFLARIETGLQNLIERSLERIAGGGLTAASLAVMVARAMEASLRKDQGGRSWAPDKFDLLLHPKDLEALLEETPDLKAFLVKAVLQAARDGGFSVAEEPRIALEVDAKTARTKVHVHAFHSQDIPAHTRQMPSLPRGEPAGVEGANLIAIDGQVYPLDLEVVNIGRLPDNHIVFADAHVSRWHAQVRLREGRHMIFDLGSRAGTRVNGEPVMEYVLQHGDVLTFAGNRLVYQQGEIAPDTSPPKGKPGASI